MGEDVKEYKTYDEQVALLESRGMDMGDRDLAVATLRRVNYYRLRTLSHARADSLLRS